MGVCAAGFFLSCDVWQRLACVRHSEMFRFRPNCPSPVCVTAEMSKARPPGHLPRCSRESGSRVSRRLQRTTRLSRDESLKETEQKEPAKGEEKQPPPYTFTPTQFARTAGARLRASSYVACLGRGKASAWEAWGVRRSAGWPWDPLPAALGRGEGYISSSYAASLPQATNKEFGPGDWARSVQSPR